MRHLRFLLFGCTVVLGSILVSSPAHAAAPNFSISATSVTMPSSGSGSIPFTLTSVNGYVGSIVVQCSDVNAPTGAKIPYCGAGLLHAYDLAANTVVKDNLTLAPYGAPIPAGLAGGALLLGFGLRRRRKSRWATLALALVGTLFCLGGAVGCGGNPNGMTPGTYTYTVTASDIKTNLAVSTTANVTVH